MENIYYKLLVNISNACNNKITFLENKDKVRLFQSKLANYKLENTMLFEYPHGSVILLKDDEFPKDVIDLLGDYGRLSNATQNAQPSFRITNVYTNDFFSPQGFPKENVTMNTNANVNLEENKETAPIRDFQKQPSPSITLFSNAQPSQNGGKSQ